jgi:hypothetical protein
MRPEKKLKIAVLKLYDEGKTVEEIARFTALKKQEHIIADIISEHLSFKESIEKLEEIVGLDNIKVVNICAKSSKYILEEKEDSIEPTTHPPSEPTNEIYGDFAEIGGWNIDKNGNIIEPDKEIINLIINAPENIEDDYKQYYYNQYAELKCKNYNEYSAVFDYFLKSRNIYWQNLTNYDLLTLIRLYNDILYLVIN